MEMCPLDNVIKHSSCLGQEKDHTLKESESCSVMSRLCDPIDYTVHGILQARILECVAFPFSRGSSQPREHTSGVIKSRFQFSQLTGAVASGNTQLPSASFLMLKER